MPDTLMVPIIFDHYTDLKNFINRLIDSLPADELNKLHEQLIVAKDGNTYFFQDMVAELRKENHNLPNISFPLTNGGILKLHEVELYSDIKKELLVFSKPLNASLAILIGKKSRYGSTGEWTSTYRAGVTKSCDGFTSETTSFYFPGCAENC